MRHYLSSLLGWPVGRSLAALALAICSFFSVAYPTLGAALLEQKSGADALQRKSPDGAEAQSPGKANETSKKNGKSESGPRISLGELIGNPGDELMIPLYYKPAEAEPVRSLTLDIDFVSNHLKFQKASPGVFPEGMAADVTATVSQGAPDPKGVVRSKVRVKVALKEQNPRKGLPEALLAFLQFQVARDAKPFSIKLTPSVISAEDLRSVPRKVAEIAADPGTVVVQSRDFLPEVSCFFFTH